MIQVDRASEGDWREIRRLCCETGRSGKPIERERWPFFGEFWIAPYERLESRWGYVLRDGAVVSGYLTGCPDTVSFERRRARLQLPLFGKALLSQALGYPYARTADLPRFLRRRLGIDPTPEALFPRGFLPELYSDYPAHLHINLDARYRGQGLGRKLVDAYMNDLARTHARGVHLFCGIGPVPFYQGCGFSRLGEVTTAAGATVLCLGRKV